MKMRYTSTVVACCTCVRYAEQARLTRSYVSEVCAIERPSSVASAVNWTCGVYARSPSIHVPMLPCNFIPVQPRLYTGTSRSTQPCIPPGSLNRVPASAGVRARMSPLRQPGRQTHFCAVCSQKSANLLKDVHKTPIYNKFFALNSEAPARGAPWICPRCNTPLRPGAESDESAVSCATVHVGFSVSCK